MPEFRPYPKPRRKRTTRGARSRSAVESVRPDIYERDEHLCVVAGSLWAAEWPCSRDLTVQHAVGKGAGGSELYDGRDWLRTMCGAHNTMAEINADFGRLCTWFGWSVPRSRVFAGTITSDKVPVRYPDGRDYILNPDGSRSHVLAGTAYAQRVALYGADAEPTR